MRIARMSEKTGEPANFTFHSEPLPKFNSSLARRVAARKPLAKNKPKLTLTNPHRDGNLSLPPISRNNTSGIATSVNTITTRLLIGLLNFFHNLFFIRLSYLVRFEQAPNGLRYLRWGGDGEAVQPEKIQGVGNCLGCAQNPQRQVHALLGVV